VPIEQTFRVFIDIRHSVRIAVAGEEALDVERVPVTRRADENDSALPVFHQPDAPKRQRSDDQLGDVGLRFDQPAEGRAGQTEDASVGTGPAADENLAAVEEVQLAGELRGPVDGNDLFVPFRPRIEDLDRAIQNDEEVAAPLAAGEERRPLRQRLDLAVALQSLDLLRRQLRESLRLPFIRVGWVYALLTVPSQYLLRQSRRRASSTSMTGTPFRTG
jgi:hypothetical protein